MNTWLIAGDTIKRWCAAFFLLGHITREVYRYLLSCDRCIVSPAHIMENVKPNYVNFSARPIHNKHTNSMAHHTWVCCICIYTVLLDTYEAWVWRDMLHSVELLRNLCMSSYVWDIQIVFKIVFSIKNGWK